MKHSDADTERTRIVSVQTLPSGFPALASYVRVFTRVKPSDPNASEVVGERQLTRTVVRTVKNPGQPDTLVTGSETISVFDILAH